MAEQSAGSNQAPVRRKSKRNFEEGSLGRACLFSFAASAGATLIICGAIRPPQSPELWQRIQTHRVNSTPKRQAKGASAASGLSTSEPTLTER